MLKLISKIQFIKSSLAILLFLLYGCQSQRPPTDWTDNTLPSKISGAKDNSVVKLADSMKKQNIKVISVGQEYLIAIPSQTLFPTASPQLSWGAFAVLNEVSAYLKQFRKIEVYVTSFSGKYRSNRRDAAMTEARARAVADYLWSQGVDARFIFSRGQGSQRPVVNIANVSDDNPNSRIEITFREAIQ